MMTMSTSRGRVQEVFHADCEATEAYYNQVGEPVFFLSEASKVECRKRIRSALDRDNVSSMKDIMIEEGLLRGHIDFSLFHGDMTILHCAVFRGADNCTRWLVEHGASIMAECANKSTPIHLACARGRANVLCILLDGKR